MYTVSGASARSSGTMEAGCVKGRMCSKGHELGSIDAARVNVEAEGEKWGADGLRGGLDLVAPMGSAAACTPRNALW